MVSTADFSLPVPQPDAEYREAFRRANDHFRQSGTQGSVLLELQIDARGAVTEAQAIDPPHSYNFPITMSVLLDSEANELLAPPRTHDPELHRTAETLARLLRFRPAEQGGVPVAVSSFRITLSFE